MKKTLLNVAKDDTSYNQYMLDEGFFVQNPYEQKGLIACDQKISEGEDAKVLNKYDYRVERVYCHRCGYAKHYKGLSVEIPDGIALIGNCCAEYFFGPEAWARAENTLRQRESELIARYRFKQLGSAYTSLVTLLDAYTDVCAQLDRAKRDMRKRLGSDDYAHLRTQCIRNHNRLVVHVLMPDPQRPNHDKMMVVIRATVAGFEFLKFEHPLEAACEMLQQEISLELEKVSITTDSVDVQKHINIYTRDLIQRLEKFESLVQEGCRLFTVENLQNIQAWIAEDGKKRNSWQLERRLPVCFEPPRERPSQVLKEIFKV